MESSTQHHDSAATALFVSDAHFGTDHETAEKERVNSFVAFLRYAREQADTLYIVGDLFDFWFEYRQVLPRTHIMVLTELDALVRSGVRVIYLAGNHDYWIGESFTDMLGIEVSYNPLDLDIQGKRVLVTHGDELTAGHDPAYRFLRRIVRSRFAIRAYHFIHPDIGIPFARWASSLSRGYTNRKKFILNRTLDAAVRNHLRKGYDGVIMGHIHHADHLHYDEGELLILGDWIEYFTYAEMHDGKMRLKRWGEE